MLDAVRTASRTPTTSTQLIKQLENDDSDKVRLAAALNLAKLGDEKAILPLAKRS